MTERSPANGPDHERRAAVGVWLAALLLVVALPTAAQAPPVADWPVAIDIRAQRLDGFDIRDPSRRQFGGLEFRGGLVLHTTSKLFGGLSAIRVAADGAAFIAVTDKGWWLRGRIEYDESRPSGITDAEMAPILGPDGRPLAARGWYDTEAVAENGGILYVAVERVHQILRFNYGRDGLLARGQPIAVPEAMRSLSANKGIEALVFVPRGLPLEGTLIAISERSLDGAGNAIGFMIGGPNPGAFTVRRSSDFDIGDAALLPGGDILLLERKFTWTSGLNVRLRRLLLADIRPGAVVDGPILFAADLGQEIDNLEGLSVHRSPAGETVLTLISDDNFSLLQRTLLLQFVLAEP